VRYSRQVRAAIRTTTNAPILTRIEAEPATADGKIDFILGIECRLIQENTRQKASELSGTPGDQTHERETCCMEPDRSNYRCADWRGCSNMGGFVAKLLAKSETGELHQREASLSWNINPRSNGGTREAEIILLCVRWYLRYPLSYRHLEELMQERGLKIDHTTIYRWVQHYAPELERRCRPHLQATNDSGPRRRDIGQSEGRVDVSLSSGGFGRPHAGVPAQSQPRR
jgi:hypothetical protein